MKWFRVVTTLVATILAGLGWAVFNWNTAINSGTVAVGALVVSLTVVWPLGRRLAVLSVFRIGTGFTLIELAVLGWTVFEWSPELNISIMIMGGFIVLQTIVSYLWARPYMADADAKVPAAADASSEDKVPPEVNLAPNSYADAAKLAITTQGVVLGLVSFTGESLSNATLKAGAASLAAGVLIATVLYLLVAQAPPPDVNRKYASAYCLSLLLWALGFGLVCVVAGNWKTT